MLGRRLDTSLTGKLEASIVCRLAPHIPAFLTPGRLALLGGSGAGLAALSLPACGLSGWFVIPAIFGLALHGVGGSLRGAVARHGDHGPARVGFLLDRCGAVSSFGAIILGLGLSPYLDLRLALVLLVVYLVNSLYALMRLVVDGADLVGLGGFGATEGRIAIASWAIFLQAAHANPLDWKIAGAPLLDVAGGALLAVVLVAFVLRVGRDVERQRDVERALSAGSFAGGKLIAIPRSAGQFHRPAAVARGEAETRRT